jgi:protease-4
VASVRKILLGLWRGLDGLRKVLHLVLLLALASLIIGVLHTSMPTVPQRAALVVAPQGRLVEQLTGDPLERAIETAQTGAVDETSLWSLVEAIRGAAHDNRIRVLVLDLDDMQGAGLPELEELTRAIDVFRATGKPVLAYGGTYNQDQYFVASHASQIYLDPSGYVLIRGFGQYQLYFAGLLKKLGVHVHVFRIGKYKSAVEIFTRDDMSKADHKQAVAYLDSMWSTYQHQVTAARGLPGDAIARYVASLSRTVPAAHGDAAAVALKDHLVTALADRVQFEHRVVALVGAGKDGSFNAISAQAYAQIVKARRRVDGAGKPRVGVIVASGAILNGEQPPGRIGGASLSQLIRAARHDKRIKAVVLRIDSPGGSVTAAEEIYHQLVALRRAGKPLVVSMGDLAASGGYYIAAPANQIWASPATITGSIGIFAIIPTFRKALAKLGVHSDGVGTTPLAGALAIGQPLGPQARVLIRSQIDRGYAQFVARVGSGRHMTDAQVNAIGQGRVWSGAAARHIGLVDHLGTLEDAVRAAARLAKIKNYQMEFIRPHLSWAQQLLQRAQTRAALAAVDLFGPRLRMPGLMAFAAPLRPYAHELQMLSRFGTRGQMYAYCFCRSLER